MNEFEKNFHINFSPLYFVAAFMLFMLWANETKADEIEEVVVVAEQSSEKTVDPTKDINLIISRYIVFINFIILKRWI